MNKTKAERRRQPRTESNVPLKISKEGLDVITETRNISCSGVYCRVNKPLPLMSKINITLLLPIQNRKRVSTEQIKCKGIVVRSEPEILKEADTAYQNIAIFFTDLSKRNRAKVAQYVLQSFKKDLL